MKTWQGSLGVSPHEGIVSPAYFVAEPVAPVESRFIHHLLRSQPLVAEYGARSKGIRPSQWDLPWEEFSRIVVALPCERGQRAIADFLDAETARIDALIAKKRRLVSLLQDRWIEHVREAITGGVRFTDPLAVTKEELDWDTARAVKLSWFLHFGSGTTPPSTDESMYGGEISWVLTGDLNDGRLPRTSRTVTQKALREIGPLVVHPPGSLVIAMYGATIGKLAILDIPACVNQACSVLIPRGEDRVEFVFYWLLAHRQQLVERGYGAGQPNISQELLKAIRIALPPVRIQNGIIRQVSQSRAKLSARL